MMDEEESEKVYSRVPVLENLLKRSKESLANEIYNCIISESLAEESIPYMGWFWRDCDFVGKYVTIGVDLANEVGIMEDNKWEYKGRRVTEAEVCTFMESIDRVLAVDHDFSDDMGFYRKRRELELERWVQGLSI